MVLRAPKELKFDPNQPRKDISEEAVKSLAQTYDSQNIINEPEIDENGKVITGELRIRASIKKNLKNIKCKLITGLTEVETFERQVIENLNHNDLNDKDKENAIRKLWESGSYKNKAELASRIGMTEKWVRFIIKLPEIRKNLGIKEVQNISPTSLIAIQSLTIDEQRKIVAKINSKQLKQGTELRELVVGIRKLPEDLKKAVLDVKKPIDLEAAKTIAVFPEEEQRGKFIREYQSLIRIKGEIAEDIKYHSEIIKGKRPRKKIIKDILQVKMEKLFKLKLSIFNQLSERYIDAIDNDEFKQKAFEILKEIFEFVKEELKKFDISTYQNVIEIKESE
ncbi:hypothetical protein LCGC14_1940170 [marine sediment metagenome]|uniref:ParB-like N-terminal domain-containing protein n=1 Tax=marine sediment metagenome TaxID=412755 RepID=A0A0F9HYZ4_9ZZZZ